MFDLNLIKKPGLQTEEEQFDNTDNIVNIESSQSKSKTKYKKAIKKKKNWTVLVVSAFLLFFVYAYVLINNSLNPLFEKKHAVDLFPTFRIINANSSSIILEKFKFDENSLDIKIKTLEKKTFYNLMDAMSELYNFNVKGSNINNLYTVNVKLAHKSYIKSLIAIDELNKELSDFNINVESEIFNDKLILVLDKNNMFVLIDFLSKLNLLNGYLLDIEIIKNISSNIELYQMIIE